MIKLQSLSISTLAVGWLRELWLCQKKQHQKLRTQKMMVIDRVKISKTVNEVKSKKMMNNIQMGLTVLINMKQTRFQKYHLLESKYD